MPKMRILLWYFYILFNILKLCYGTQLSYLKKVWFLWVFFFFWRIFFFLDQSTANFSLKLISPHHRGKNPLSLVDSLWIMTFSSQIIGVDSFSGLIWARGTTPSHLFSWFIFWTSVTFNNIPTHALTTVQLNTWTL